MGWSIGFCVTAQHREMLDSVLELFELHPEFDLDVMAPNQDITHVTCAVLTGMRDVLAEVRPDRVLVHGDPTTALAAALAAYYAKVPVRARGGGAAHGRPVCAVAGRDEPPHRGRDQ